MPRLPQFALVTFNVRNFPPMKPRLVEHDVALIRDRADIIAWQEQWSERNRSIIRRTLGEGFGNVLLSGDDLGNGISYRRSKFTYVAHGKFHGHGKVRFASGERPITWAHLRSRHGHGALRVYSGHPVPGSFAKGYRPNRKARRRAWESYMSRLAAHASLATKRGHAVFIGMDGNAPRAEVWRKFKHIPGVRLYSNGIDHIILIPPRQQTRAWRVAFRRAIPGAFSDHDPFRLLVNLVPSKG